MVRWQANQNVPHRAVNGFMIDQEKPKHISTKFVISFWKPLPFLPIGVRTHSLRFEAEGTWTLMVDGAPSPSIFDKEPIGLPSVVDGFTSPR